MRAAELLGDLDRSVLRVSLIPVRPEAVAVRPVPRPLRRLWPKWAAAMTMPWGIYVRPDVLDGDDAALARIIAHELIHTRQWKTHGPVRFLRQYLAEYVRGRARRLGHKRAYRNISLEAEAYDLVNRL